MLVRNMDIDFLDILELFFKLFKRVIFFVVCLLSFIWDKMFVNFGFFFWWIICFSLYNEKSFYGEEVKVVYFVVWDLYIGFLFIGLSCIKLLIINIEILLNGFLFLKIFCNVRLMFEKVCVFIIEILLIMRIFSW